MHRPQGLAWLGLDTCLVLRRRLSEETWTQARRIDSSCTTHSPRSSHLLLSENMLSNALFTSTDHPSPSPLEPKPHHWASVKLGCLLHPDTSYTFKMFKAFVDNYVANPINRGLDVGL
jgi:hypothetical protein